jgi:outer membrane protein
MKTNLIALAAILFLSNTLSADMTRVEMGAGVWTQDTKGTMSYTDNGATGQYKSAEKDYSQAYAWMLIKHPIPILPNLRLEYVQLDDEGAVSGKFKDFELPVGVTSTLTYDMKQYDVIPYYNILDNTAWTTLDIGLDLKVIDYSYTVGSVAGLYDGYNDSDVVVIPLLYVRTRLEIPATDFGIEADVKYVQYKDSKVYDVRAKIDYTLSFIPVIQPALEIGYRMQKIDIDDSDKTLVNMEYSGVYAGLMVRF